MQDEASFQAAIEAAESALALIDHLAVQQIRSGAEISSHVEAAQRNLRESLRQLVLGEREALQHADHRAIDDGADAASRSVPETAD